MIYGTLSAQTTNIVRWFVMKTISLRNQLKTLNTNRIRVPTALCIIVIINIQQELILVPILQILQNFSSAFQSSWDSFWLFVFSVFVTQSCQIHLNLLILSEQDNICISVSLHLWYGRLARSLYRSEMLYEQKFRT